MHKVRCAGCRQAIGFASTDGSQRTSIYCSTWCANEPKVERMELRNDEWRILYAHGWTPLAIAKKYDISHSLVYRTLKRTNSAI